MAREEVAPIFSCNPFESESESESESKSCWRVGRSEDSVSSHLVEFLRPALEVVHRNTGKAVRKKLVNQCSRWQKRNLSALFASGKRCRISPIRLAARLVKESPLGRGGSEGNETAEMAQEIRPDAGQQNVPDAVADCPIPRDNLPNQAGCEEAERGKEAIFGTQKEPNKAYQNNVGHNERRQANDGNRGRKSTRIEKKVENLGRRNREEEDGEEEADQRRIHYGPVLVSIEPRPATTGLSTLRESQWPGLLLAKKPQQSSRSREKKEMSEGARGQEIRNRSDEDADANV
ncbi:hypothetical protein UVI_02063590 [Ustilaginoidea virens]|uniref:Uncharacterized protein n=1 Tax=Ustilaginoidea virens TaxID=1159556 RepID=A0A1B5L6G5_USTVR|nr:hypothetical protein UVI_02063590 [Ustilaginoidea virens]